MFKIKETIVGIVIGSILTMSICFAESTYQTIEVIFNSINLKVNGKVVKADNILYNNVTYVPLRVVAEMMGREVSWDGGTSTADIKDKKIVIDPNAIEYVGKNYSLSLLKIKDKLYGMDRLNQTLFKKDNKYYMHFTSAVNLISGITAIRQNKYTVTKNGNEFISGDITFNNEFYNIKFDSKNVSLNEFYYYGYIERLSDNKQYVYSTMKGQEVGCIFHNDSILVPLEDFFKYFDLENSYKIEFDDKNSTILYDIQ